MMKANQGATLIRVLTAMVLLPSVLAIVWLPQLEPLYLVLIALLAGVGLNEYFAIVRARNVETWPTLATAFGVLMVVAAEFSPELMNTALVVGVVVLAWGQVFRGQVDMASLSMTFWGLFYAGWMPAHFVLLHNRESGPGLVTLLIVLIALSDTGAYFVGKAVGRRKLSPKISPNKTWEGAVAGVLSAVVGMALAWYIDVNYPAVPLPGWPLWAYALCGIVLAITGQIGDLIESMMKRDAGVKDSGKLLPGHGGILDRCDGFLFAGPVLYYLLAWL